MEHSESSSAESTQTRRTASNISAVLLAAFISIILVGGLGFMAGMYLGYGEQMWAVMPEIFNLNFWR